MLPEVWPLPGVDDEGDGEALRRLLLNLPPEAVLTLGPMLPQFSPSEIQLAVMGTIASLAQKDLAPLQQLIEVSEGWLAEQLLIVLGGMPGEKATRILVGMLAHPMPNIKCSALRALMSRQRGVIEEIVPLIADPSPEVSTLALQHLGARKSEKAEGLLRDYIKDKRCRRSDREHILACYRALGLCGSAASIAYLRDVILDESLLPDVSKSLHRQGAAVALNLLAGDEAGAVLLEASESRFSSVRLACRKAREYEAELGKRKS
jgi:HEAT repeat protein